MTVTSCLVYKVIRDLYSIDRLCINPTRFDLDGARVIIGFWKKLKIQLRLVLVYLLGSGKFIIQRRLVLG